MGTFSDILIDDAIKLAAETQRRELEEQLAVIRSKQANAAAYHEINPHPEGRWSTPNKQAA